MTTNVGKQFKLTPEDQPGALLTVQPDGSYEYDPNGAFDDLGAGASRNDFFTYTMADATGATSTTTVTVTVQGKNDAPTGITLSGDRVTQSNVVGTLSTSDLDLGDTHTYTILSQPSSNFAIVNSQLVLNNRTGMSIGQQQLVTIQTTDALGSSLTQVFPITVASLGTANQAPIANPDSFSGTVLAVHALQVLTNDSDPDNDPIMITKVNGVGIDIGTPVFLSLGRLELVSRNGNVNFHFFPNGTTGTQSFNYTISDGDLTSTASVTINLGGANRPPVANADNFGSVAPLVLEDTVFAGNVQLNDSDPDGDVLTSVLLTQPAKGTVSMLADGSFTFTPLPNANGLTTFTYRVLDGQGGVATATVTISITSVNDAPTGTDKTISLTRNPDVAASDMIFAESDFGFLDPLDSPVNTLAAVRIASLPASGSLTLNGVAVAANSVVPVANIQAGQLRYAPAVNGFGTNYSSFDFQVVDNGGTANGGVDTDATPNKMSFNVSSTDVTSPTVVGVYVNSTAWSASFRDFVDGITGDGSAIGYRVPTGAGQSAILPWINMNQVIVRFSESVGSSLTASDFAIQAIAGLRADATPGVIPVIQGVTYDNATNTAIITLNTSLDASTFTIVATASGVTDVSGNLLDGDWVNGTSSVSGNGTAGGNLNFTMNILPGDTNRDGFVNSADPALISGTTRNIGNPLYNQFFDVDGNGSQNTTDRTQVSRRVGSRRNP